MCGRSFGASAREMRTQGLCRRRCPEGASHVSGIFLASGRDRGWHFLRPASKLEVNPTYSCREINPPSSISIVYANPTSALAYPPLTDRQRQGTKCNDGTSPTRRYERDSSPM